MFLDDKYIRNKNGTWKLRLKTIIIIIVTISEGLMNARLSNKYTHFSKVDKYFELLVYNVLQR